MRRLKRAHQRHIKYQAKRRKKFRQQAIAAGTAAAITLVTGVGINKALAAYSPDPHELSVSQDADADLLANKEELAIGYRVFNADQNRNEIPDGVELAKRCAAVIEQLPHWLGGGDPPNEIYKERWVTGIFENCGICQQSISTGGWSIVNPKLGLSYPNSNDPLCPVHLPDIMIHYTEHGSLSCAGEHYNGRVNLPQLMRVLELRYPYDPNEHQLPLDYVVDPNGQLAPDANDLDGDLLADSEELEVGYNLHDPDQDDDLTPDGIELAKQCAAIIKELPSEYEADPNQTYRVCHELDGLEQCDICGQWIHMGGCAIVNPKLGLTYPDSNDSLDPLFLPDLVLHYMEHGSFSCTGTEHRGRVDIALLAEILEMPQRCGDLGTMYLPGDLNEDCKVDLADFTRFADKWLESTKPGQD